MVHDDAQDDGDVVFNNTSLHLLTGKKVQATRGFHTAVLEAAGVC